MNGAFNAISPEHQTNKSFTKALAKTLGKPMWLPNIPSFILKIMFGEMADMLLYGSRVSSAKILDAGFEFQYPNLDRALADLMKD